MSPKRVGASWATLPMLLDDAHRALGERLSQAFAKDCAWTDPRGVCPSLGDLGVLQYLVPTLPTPGTATESARPLVHDAHPRGAAIGIRTLCVIREELAYVSPLADGIFAVQGLGSYPIVLAGEQSHRSSVLAEVVRGKRVGAFALTEPEAGSDVASMQTTARSEGDTYVLSGTKHFISNVGIADHYIVFANADPSRGKKGISAFLVDANAPGLAAEPMATSGGHPLGRVTLRECRVPRESLLGEVGQGLRLALGTLDVFRTSVGAAAVGMARRALDETLVHVTTRMQFGKTLAAFQLTQASLADMATELEAARLLVYRAAWEKDHAADPRAHAASVAMAKMYATEAAQRIIDRAVRLFGGLGVTGSVVDHLYRDIRPLRIYEGTTEIQKLIIGNALVGDAGS